LIFGWPPKICFMPCFKAYPFYYLRVKLTNWSKVSNLTVHWSSTFLLLCMILCVLFQVYSLTLSVDPKTGLVLHKLPSPEAGCRILLIFVTNIDLFNFVLIVWSFCKNIHLLLNFSKMYTKKSVTDIINLYIYKHLLNEVSCNVVMWTCHYFHSAHI